MDLKSEIKTHCKILKIKRVKVRFTDKLDCWSRYKPEWRVVLIKRGLLVKEVLFALAHEMRHAWQVDNGVVGEYVERNKISKADYNNQWVEVDANAYGCLYMQAVYGTYPLFDDLDVETREKIEKRKGELKDDYRICKS